MAPGHIRHYHEVTLTEPRASTIPSNHAQLTIESLTAAAVHPKARSNWMGIKNLLQLRRDSTMKPLAWQTRKSPSELGKKPKKWDKK